MEECQVVKKRWIGFFLIFLCAALVLVRNTTASTTGKIAGKIMDAASREPLAGANIRIEATALGTVSDLEGDFSIINIPPGTYTLRASMMGYVAKRMQGIRVRIDLTTRVDFALAATVLDAGESVTVVADRPLVQKDMTYSLSSVSSDEIQGLPVQDIAQVMELQAGVIQSGGLHIRGGRSGEIAYWVDGVSTTDIFSGGMGVRVENSAVEELQIVSGTFNAEYGQAMSGIINIITKEGGNEYHGGVKLYAGDYYSTSDIYNVMKKINYNKSTGQVIEESENPIKNFNPIYNAEFSLSGPVPLAKEKLTFFANSRYYSQEGYLYGRELFKPQGLPGDSSLVPMNPSRQFSTQAKLTFKPTGDFKLGYNFFYNRYHQDRTFIRNYKYNPGGVPLQKGGGVTHMVTINHILSPRTFYELRVNNFYREHRSYLYENPETRPHWLVRILADSVHAEAILDLDNAEQVGRFEEYKQLERKFEYFVDPNNYTGYVSPDSARSPAGYSFYRAGNVLNRFFRSTAYWLGKFDLTSQISKTHLIKLGTELRFYKLTMDDIALQARQSENGTEQIVPFMPYVPPVSTLYHDQYTRRPKEFSAYIQDKMEYKDIIFNLGLRFDYFDANHVVPADPTDPNIYDPFKYEHIYKNWQAPPPGTYGAALDEWEARFEKYTPDERKAFMHKKVEAKMKLSPRLAVAYPITDRGVIHFSYGHFFQIPEFQYLYDGPDFKLASGGGRLVIGNADLHCQSTAQYEIGLQQQLTENIGVDVTLFYRDIRDWVGTSPIITTSRASVGYSIYENKDYSNVRGVTLSLEKRLSSHMNYNIDYTYQVAEGTYSNPEDAFNAIIANQQPRINLIPMSWDQRHTFNARMVYRYGGWIASFIGKYWSGRPYTPSFTKGASVGSATFSGLTENSARMPTTTSVDFHLLKEFKLARFGLSVFMYVYNLFDQRESAAVFSDTGTADYTTYPKISDVPYSPDRIGTVKDYLSRPEWYIAPREIHLGFSVDF